MGPCYWSRNAEFPKDAEVLYESPIASLVLGVVFARTEDKGEIQLLGEYVLGLGTISLSLEWDRLISLLSIL
jgi:hypothetical protein